MKYAVWGAIIFTLIVLAFYFAGSQVLAWFVIVIGIIAYFYLSH